MPAAADLAAASPSNVSPEAIMREREAAMQVLLLDIGRREAAIAGARHQLEAQSQTLEQREEELFIREAAMDEAEALAAEMEGSLTAAETQAARQSGDLLEGTADAADILLEGPAAVAAYDSKAVALSVTAPTAVTSDPSPSPRDEEADKAARAEERAKLKQEGEQLLTLTRDLPFLSFVEPRVMRAEADDKMDYPTMLGFYGL
jgi:hypothetical protein